MNFIVEMFAVAVFVAVFLLLEGAYTLWSSFKESEARSFEKRLGEFGIVRTEVGNTSLMKHRTFSEIPWVDRTLRQVPPVVALDNWLVQAGQSTSVGRFLLVNAGVALAALVVALLLGMEWLATLLIVGMAVAIPTVVVQNSRQKRLQKFDEQLPDALDLIARALRAGHAFPSAIQMVASEAQEPISSEFRTTFEEINYGIPLNEAMQNFASRVPSLDLRYFIVAVILQRETGGNLAELLGNLSTLIRERFKLIGKIRVLSAEGRMSGYVLSGVPFAAAGFIYLTNPKFLSLLWTDPMGLKMLAGAAVLMVIGGIWMRNIVRIRI